MLPVIISFILFFISRVFFINSTGVFFDSAEYIGIFNVKNYLQAIAFGHFPPHAGYNLLFWPIFNISQYLHFNGAYVVVVVQIILSFISLMCFYYVITYVTDKKTGIYASILSSLIPIIWIITVTVMMENAYITYFFVSLWLLIKYLKNKTNPYLLYLSCIVFGLGVITQTFVVLWAPLYLWIVFLDNKKECLKICAFLVLCVFIMSAINILFISREIAMSPQYTFRQFYLSKGSEFAYLPLSPKGFLVFMRNFLIPLYSNNTIVLTAISFVSLCVLFFKKRSVFVLGVLWILPAMYANQWWDALLPGRHAILASFGIAFLTAYLFRNKPIVIFLIGMYLLWVSIPTLYLLRLQIPYLEEAQLVSTLPKNSLLLESHFARPQVQATIKNTTIYVNEPGWPMGTLPLIIETYLHAHRDVFVSSAALSEPYGLYTGPYVHSLTLSYTDPYVLQPDLSHFTLREYKTISKNDNIILYQIVSDKKAPYPFVLKLVDSNRRINYYDPFSFIERSLDVTFRKEGI